jgi:hypothetical protein
MSLCSNARIIGVQTEFDEDAGAIRQQEQEFHGKLARLEARLTALVADYGAAKPATGHTWAVLVLAAAAVIVAYYFWRVGSEVKRAKRKGTGTWL